MAASQKTLFQYFARPSFSAAILLLMKLDHLSNYNIHRLQLAQNLAARIVLGAGRRVSADPLLRELHWLPVRKRIQFKIAILTFKTVTTRQPAYLSDLLTPYVPSRCLRSSESNFLTVPRVDSVLQSRAFSYAAPHLWNSLPASLRGLAVFPASPVPSFVTTASSFSVSGSTVVPSDNFAVFKSKLKPIFSLTPLFWPLDLSSFQSASVLWLVLFLFTCFYGANV